MFFEAALIGLTWCGAELLTEDTPAVRTVRTVFEEVKWLLTAQDEPSESDLWPRTPASDPAPVVHDHASAVAVREHYKDASVVTVGAMALAKVIPVAGIPGFASYVYGMGPHVRKVLQDVRDSGDVTVDSLFLLADALALLSHSYLAAAFSLYLIQEGKLAVVRAKDTSMKHVRHLFTELPESVSVLVNGSERLMPLQSLQRGDRVVLHAGQVIPVDGVIEEGSGGIDQHVLTGESQLVETSPGDSVFANTALTSGRIVVTVEKSGPETTANQVAQILFRSVDHKSELQLRGEAWADRLVRPMFYSSVALLPFLGPVSTSVFINAHIGMRIRILAPMSTLKHISAASRKGILVKDGRALEKFLEIDTILFDKTGTLTSNEPEVVEVNSAGRLTVEEIVRYAAIAEQKLSHPIARAIVQKARAMDLDWPDLSDSNYTVGYGIKVVCDGETIEAGSLRYLDREGIELPAALTEQIDGDRNLVFIVLNGEVAGALQLKPCLRLDMAGLIARLRAQGIRHLAIVSGDSEAPTRLLAEQLGMDEYFAGVLPQDKAEIVRRLQAEGRKVCFVGDGINDAIALKHADVSVSLAGAHSIARDMAEIVLMDGHVGGLGHLHEISTQLERDLQQSLRYSLAPGGINLLGAFLLHFNTLTSLLVNATFGIAGAMNTLPEPETPGDRSPGHD